MQHRKLRMMIVTGSIILTISVFGVLIMLILMVQIQRVSSSLYNCEIVNGTCPVSECYSAIADYVFEYSKTEYTYHVAIISDTSWITANTTCNNLISTNAGVSIYFDRNDIINTMSLEPSQYLRYILAMIAFIGVSMVGSGILTVGLLIRNCKRIESTPDDAVQGILLTVNS